MNARNERKREGEREEVDNQVVQVYSIARSFNDYLGIEARFSFVTRRVTALFSRQIALIFCGFCRRNDKIENDYETITTQDASHSIYIKNTFVRPFH